MADQRKGGISWCDETWNPTRGCSRVSPGCENCWAMPMANRMKLGEYHGLVELADQGPVWTGKARLAEDQLEKPRHWKKPRRVAVSLMGDLFHHDIGFFDLRQVFYEMERYSRHTYLLLTKRPTRALEFFRSNEGARYRAMRNVWFGVTAENQAMLEERVEVLRNIPALVRWVSLEPLLERIEGIPAGLDGIVVGAESGSGARPCRLEWIEDVVRQCDAAGVPVHVKQIRRFGELVRDFQEFPENVRRRDW